MKAFLIIAAIFIVVVSGIELFSLKHEVTRLKAGASTAVATVTIEQVTVVPAQLDELNATIQRLEARVAMLEKQVKAKAVPKAAEVAPRDDIGAKNAALAACLRAAADAHIAANVKAQTLVEGNLQQWRAKCLQ